MESFAEEAASAAEPSSFVRICICAKNRGYRVALLYGINTVLPYEPGNALHLFQTGDIPISKGVSLLIFLES